MERHCAQALARLDGQRRKPAGATAGDFHHVETLAQRLAAATLGPDWAGGVADIDADARKVKDDMGKAMADPLSHPPAPATAVKKTRWLFYGCGTLIALLLVIVGTVVIPLWWIQRPIKPVVLSTQEKTAI